ncbi:amidase domain-containing protein [Streptomyces sp. NPDC058439]|uniref:amidase domain-containing protein n=1 Tax=Streptomyces sp. NPDC058439 TaxID=3346500 RepID=UPI003666D9CA
MRRWKRSGRAWRPSPPSAWPAGPAGSAGQGRAEPSRKEAKVTWRKYDSQATPGDVVFWKFKSNKPIQHAAMVIAKSGSSVTIAQHTSKYRTSTMAAARSRNHPYSVWIAHVTPRW